MKIVHSSGQAYDLPANFMVEMTRTNPFFHKMGEQSLPCSLPPTSRNMHLLGQPANIGNKNKIEGRIDVTIESGSFFMKARQAVLTAKRNEPIETSFYLNEGAFYERIENLTLKEIFKDKSVEFSNVDSAISFMQTLLSQHDERFSCFSVITNNRELNALYYGDNPWFVNTTDRTEVIDGKSIFIPKGMFITPFVKVRHVLQEISTYLGYTLDASFMDNAPFKDMVFLNNNADTIITGRIDYVDIVPEISVSDFFDVIRKFCCEIIPDEVNKRLRIIHFNDVLNAIPESDLTKKITGELVMSYHGNYKQLLLTSNVLNIPEDAAPFSNTGIGVNIKKNSPNLYDLSVKYPTGHISDKYGYIYRIGYRGESVITEKIGTLHCNYYSGDQLVNEEKKFPDYLVEIYMADRSYPYVGQTRYLRTSLVFDDSGENEKVENSNSDLLPAMLCLYFYDSTRKYNIGTIHNKDLNGNKLWDFTLAYNGSEGIYEKFWRQYDNLLRNALLEVRGEFYLDESDKMMLSSYRNVIVNSQKLIPSEIKYIPGVMTPQECSFLTTNLQSPISSAKSIQELFTTEEYKWGLKTQRNFTITGTIPNRRYAYIKYKSTPITYYPPTPTQSQYIAGGQYHVKQYEVEYGTVSGGVDTFVKEGDGIVTTWLEPELA